jgi:hypothetical protein
VKTQSPAFARAARSLWVGASFVIALFFAVAVPAAAAAASKVALRTVEGTVSAVEILPGEGDLELLAVELAPEQGEPMKVLLAPEETCRDIGFEIDEGDRLRVRVFVGESGEVAKAQKVQNITRGLMVRFRTMRTVPLWSATGAWHGGPSRVAPGAQHGRGGGGRGPGSGGGPGPGSGGGFGR